MWVEEFNFECVVVLRCVEGGGRGVCDDVSVCDVGGGENVLKMCD